MVGQQYFVNPSASDQLYYGTKLPDGGYKLSIKSQQAPNMFTYNKAFVWTTDMTRFGKQAKQSMHTSLKMDYYILINSNLTTK